MSRRRSSVTAAGAHAVAAALCAVIACGCHFGEFWLDVTVELGDVPTPATLTAFVSDSAPDGSSESVDDLVPATFFAEPGRTNRILVEARRESESIRVVVNAFDAAGNVVGLGEVTEARRPRVVRATLVLRPPEPYEPGVPPESVNCPSLTRDVILVSTADDERDGPEGTASVGQFGGPGDLSLREAIVLANDAAGPDEIRFDPNRFPPSTPTVLSVLPSLGALPWMEDDGTCLDGLGSQVTLSGLMLDRLSAIHGLTIASSSSGISNLDIWDFPADGVLVESASTNVLLASLRVGTDSLYGDVHGNGLWGIEVHAVTNVEILVNVVGWNAYGGIRVDTLAARVTIRSNSIDQNGGEAISMAGGGNGGVMPPVVEGASFNPCSSEWTIDGSSAAANGSVVELFCDDAVDTEARWLVAYDVPVQSGTWQYAGASPCDASLFITATVTDTNGNTSALSAPFELP